MAPITDRPSTRTAVSWTCDILQTIKMKRIASWLILGALLVGAPVASGAQQTHAKRDSVRADTLRRMVPYLSNARDRKRLDSLWVALKKDAGNVDTVRVVRTDTILRLRVDTITVVRVDTVRVPRDSAPPIIIPPPPDTSSLATRLLGPLPASLAAVALRGGAYATFASDWTRMGEQRWLTDGPVWDASNYYDRAQQWYALWRLTGDTKWRDRATAIAKSYRDQYWAAQAAPYQYNTSSYWSMPAGVALHFAVTGDTMSRNAVGWACGWLTSGYGFTRLATHSEMESRWRARMLQCAVLAHAVNAPLTGPWVGQVVPAPGATWKEKAGNILTQILAAQSADGAFRDDQSCGYTKPFMDALLADAMIEYTRLVAPDPRILPAVTKMLAYDWATTWDTVSRSFFYYEGECSNPMGSGGRYPAPDLTAMLSHSFAWVAAQSGDPIWQLRADAVFAAGVSGAYLMGSKQFNQGFWSSWRGLAIR
jgi:hypothetical protein